MLFMTCNKCDQSFDPPQKKIEAKRRNLPGTKGAFPPNKRGYFLLIIR